MSNAPALADGLAVLRLSLHVLAACIWVGGQFTMAGLVPVARGLGDEAPARLARAFGRLSWPAFWVLVATGFWNFVAVHPTDAPGSWHLAFDIKMATVALAGWSAWRHTKATTPSARGAWAGLGALASLVAMVLGVALAG